MAGRKHVIGFNTSEQIRRTVELIAAKYTLKRKRRYTMTEVMEEAVRLLAKKERVLIDGQ